MINIFQVWSEGLQPLLINAHGFQIEEPYSGLVDIQQLVLKFCPNNSTFRRLYKICNSLSSWLCCLFYTVVSLLPLKLYIILYFLPLFLFHFSLKLVSTPFLSIKYVHLARACADAHAFFYLLSFQDFLKIYYSLYHLLIPLLHFTSYMLSLLSGFVYKKKTTFHSLFPPNPQKRLLFD